jgi:ketosteroid isomerase-like protein
MTVQEDVAAFNEEFAVGLAKNDAVRVSYLYTEDAVFLSQGAPPVRGRDEIRDLFLRMPSSSEPITFESREILEDGDLVVDIGTLLVGGVGFGKYVIVHRRQADGTLKIAVDVPLGDR